MRYWIGLGSNLGDSVAVLHQAIRLLGSTPELKVVRVSRFYRSAPWGEAGQPDFVNAVLELHAEWEPTDLLEHLQRIEAELGRERSGRRWGPRVIDLDVLLVDDKIFHRPQLVVPHPRMHRRRFVLEPLASLEPCLEIPGRGRLVTLLRDLADQEVSPLEETGEL